MTRIVMDIGHIGCPGCFHTYVKHDARVKSVTYEISLYGPDSHGRTPLISGEPRLRNVETILRPDDSVGEWEGIVEIEFEDDGVGLYRIVCREVAVSSD